MIFFPVVGMVIACALMRDNPQIGAPLLIACVYGFFRMLGWARRG
jgi:hypothetical protein